MRASCCANPRACIDYATYEVGLSGPGRLHDLFVTHEAMSPGEWKSGGEGLTISYGFHPSPFGIALVMATPRGLAGLAFGDPGEEKSMLDDMRSRWTKAAYVEDKALTTPLAVRIFDNRLWRPDRPLRIVMIGTDFEVRVWETLLGIPMGKCSTYSDIASKIGRPKAARAVGAAVGKNPMSFVVPCHRVLGRSGDITGYHWGLTRKRAMLGWGGGPRGRGVGGCHPRPSHSHVYARLRPAKASRDPRWGAVRPARPRLGTIPFLCQSSARSVVPHLLWENASNPA